MARKTDTNQKKKKKSCILTDLRKGRGVSLDFFKRYAWFFLFFIVAVIALIGLRYSTQSKQVTIQKLTEELQRAENEKLNEQAQYMTLIRESEMQRLVREKNLDLDFQEQPPYRIQRDQ